MLFSNKTSLLNTTLDEVNSLQIFYEELKKQKELTDKQNCELNLEINNLRVQLDSCEVKIEEQGKAIKLLEEEKAAVSKELLIEISKTKQNKIVSECMEVIEKQKKRNENLDAKVKKLVEDNRIVYNIIESTRGVLDEVLKGNMDVQAMMRGSDEKSRKLSAILVESSKKIEKIIKKISC